MLLFMAGGEKKKGGGGGGGGGGGEDVANLCRRFQHSLRSKVQYFIVQMNSKRVTCVCTVFLGLDICMKTKMVQIFC